MSEEIETTEIPMRDRLVFLAAVVAHVRNGGIFEWGGPVDYTPRIVSSFFHLRIGPEAFGPELELQLRTRVESRKGQVTTSNFTWCEWSLQDLTDIPNEMAGGSHTQVPPAVAGLDPIVDQILSLSRLGEGMVGRTWYAIDGAALAVVDSKGNYDPVDREKLPAHEFMDHGLTEAQATAIRDAAEALRRSRSATP